MLHPLNASTLGVTVTGCILDANGTQMMTANSPRTKYLFYNQGGIANIINNRFINSAAAATYLMSAILCYSGSCNVSGNTFDSTIYGDYVDADMNETANLFIKVVGNQGSGSNTSAVYVHNSGGSLTRQSTVLYCEIANNSFQNITDYNASDTGSYGSAINVYYMDHCDIHDNFTQNTAFSGIRITSSYYTHAHHTTIVQARETAMYCGEIGSGGNLCDHNIIRNSQNGISSTNPNQAFTQSPDQVLNNYLENIGNVGIFAARTKVQGNTINGAPICVVDGGGGSSYNEFNNTISNNNCELSTTSYPHPFVAFGVDKAINFGVEQIMGNKVFPWTNMLDPLQVTIAGGAGYTSTPTCHVSGGTSVYPATCQVTESGGTITGITFPVPGNYTSLSGVSIGLTGGGSPTTPATITVNGATNGPFVANADVFPVSPADRLQVTDITYISATAVTLQIPNGTAPVANTVYCLSNIPISSAQAPMNAQCGTAGSYTPCGAGNAYDCFPLTFANVNSATITNTTWTAPIGGQKVSVWQVYSSGTTPAWSFNSHFLLQNESIPCATLTAALQSGSSVYVPDGTPSTGSCTGSGANGTFARRLNSSWSYQ